MPSSADNHSTVKRWSAQSLILTLLVSIGMWLIVALLCLCVGSTGKVAWPTYNQFLIRREYVGLASLIGAALACAGVVYQAVLRNPLADPYLLGVSSGASLAAFLWRLSAAAVVVSAAGVLTQQVFAFAGGVLAMGVVFALSTRRGRLEPVTLLLVGVIVNAVNASIFLLINTLKQDITGGAGGPLTFLVGSIQTNLTNGQEISAGCVIGLGFIVLMGFSGHLNVATLSEAEAESLGLHIQRMRWMSLIVASLMTAAAVAISGPIAFVGLICPHVARLAVGSDYRKLLPISTAVGASLLAVADAATRALSRPTMVHTLLPVGVLTGLMGGPFFLLLLWRNRHRSL